jgi:hypothetical protein
MQSFFVITMLFICCIEVDALRRHKAQVAMDHNSTCLLDLLNKMNGVYDARIESINQWVLVMAEVMIREEISFQSVPHWYPLIQVPEGRLYHDQE